MKPLLILLCTVACTLAGWLLGGSKETPQAHAITDAMSRATPPPTPAAPVAKRPHTTDVHAIIDRLNTEFGGEEQTGEMAGRLYAELQDLPSKQFAEAIANLSADGKFHAGDPAALLAGLWAERDLPAARAWMLGMKGDRGNLGRAIFDTWARADPAGMIDWLKTHGDELEPESFRGSAQFAIAKAAARTNPEEGFRVIDALTKGEAVSGFHTTLYLFWGEHDPAAAAARALAEPDEKVRAEAIERSLNGWGPRDPTAARAWAEQLADPILREQSLVTIGMSFYLKDVRKGADFLATIPPTNGARSALQSCIARWAGWDPTAALGWAAALDDEALGRSLFTKMAADSSVEKMERAIAALPPEQRARAGQRWRASREAANAEAK